MLKEKVYRHCREVLNTRIGELRLRLQELKDSVANETRSTAGDKHETARAHLQLEQEQVNKQLSVVLDQLDVLQRIDPTSRSYIVANGSLVHTGDAVFFLSVAAGKLLVDGQAILALSPQSPLGTKMMGALPGTGFEINGRRYVIKDVA